MKRIGTLFGIICTVLLTVHLSFGQTAKNLTQLGTQNDVIRNETTPGANTRGRIADMYKSIFLSSPNIFESYTDPSWLTLTFPGISGKPTTIGGYGITDFNSLGDARWLQSSTLGTGVSTALGINVGSAGSFVVNGGALGTPSSGVATNLTGLPISTGVSGLGTGVSTWLTTPSWANFNSAITGTAPFIKTGGTSLLTSNVNMSRVTLFNSGNERDSSMLRINKSSSLLKHYWRDVNATGLGDREASISISKVDSTIWSTGSYFQIKLNSTLPSLSRDMGMIIDPNAIRLGTNGGSGSGLRLNYNGFGLENSLVAPGGAAGFYSGNTEVYLANSFTSKMFGFDATGSYINLGSDNTGDIHYRNSGGYLTRRAIGTAGQVMTVSGGLPTWATPASSWSLLGNSGTVDGTNFIGTTDNVPFNIRVNNEKAGRIQSGSFTGTFFGYQAGNVDAFPENTGFGYQALSLNASSFGNTAVGNRSLQITNGGGGYNTAVGAESLYGNTTGASNVGSGHRALGSNTTGSGNTGIGLQSLLTNTTGSNNTAIGFESDVSSAALTNATAIGNGAIVTASNTMQLGNASVTQVNIGTSTTATLVTGGLRVTGGTLGANRIITSDGSGNGTWQVGATVLSTARTIGITTGDVTSAGSSFDGSANNTNALTIANDAVTTAKIINGAVTVDKMATILFKTVAAGTYTILEADKGYQITFTSTCTITLPNGLTTGHYFTVWNKSGGTLTFTATTTLNASGSTITSDNIGAYFQHIGSNIWEGAGAFGSGGVTNVSSANANATVATQTTTPVITIVNSPAVGGITITGTPSVGQSPIATSGTAATWQSPSIIKTSTNSTTETLITNYGALASSGTGTFSIRTNAHYSNNTVLIADITVFGIKSDGTTSVLGKVTGRYRKNNSGTFSVDDAGTAVISDTAILASIVPEINSTNPQILITMAGASGTYNMTVTAILNYVNY